MFCALCAHIHYTISHLTYVHDQHSNVQCYSVGYKCYISENGEHLLEVGNAWGDCDRRLLLFISMFLLGGTRVAVDRAVSAGRIVTFFSHRLKCLTENLRVSNYFRKLF